MGWLALVVPEALGGLGRRINSVALLAQAAGRALLNEPLCGSGFVAADVIVRHASAAQQAAWLPPLLAGQQRHACVMPAQAGLLQVRGGRLSGRQEVVLDADIAEQCLVLALDLDVTDNAADAPQRWFRVAANGPRVLVQPYPLLDGRGAATLVFDQTEVEALNPGNDPHPALLGALASVADAVGAMDAAFALTLDHLKTRHQFGVPLASFQVLQHRAVDQSMRLAESRAVLAQAVLSLQQQPWAAARDVHAAKAFVGEQSRLLLQEAVQLHGGIGITEEYALSHYLRRVRVDEQLYGSAEQHLRQFSALPATR
jgi:alkylation response protein AidB-like acyl-CoA dehydrogenase